MSALTLESTSTLLKFAVFALAVADQHRNKPTAPEKAENSTGGGATGPIGAGIGFAVLFLGMVLYLCKRDREEQKEEAELKEKELAEMSQVPAGSDEYGAAKGDVEEGKVEVEVEIDDQQRA